MAPYIAALTLLIVAILFAVYKRVDTFEVHAGQGQNLPDLYKALCNGKKDTSGNDMETKESSVENTSNEAPATTSRYSKEMEDRLATRIAKELKDKMLMERATQNLLDTSCPYSSYSSDAVEQGQEYRQVKPAPSAAPDMSEYIRKDSIPCWNCSLP
jgi:hypothetical protein